MEASDGIGLPGPDSPRLYQMIKDEILDGEPADEGRQDQDTDTDDDSDDDQHHDTNTHQQHHRRVRLGNAWLG